MYVLTVEESFASAHQLRGYKGKCENLHGHNWRVVVNIRGKELNEIGLLIDFHELKSMLREITGGLDHKNLNEIPFFSSVNPSSENIARFIADKLAERILTLTGPSIRLESVTVWESDTSRCTYLPKEE